MQGRRVRRAAVVVSLAAALLGGCGDDEETPAATDSETTTTAAEQEGGDANELKVEMVDYGYKVSGTLKAGLATVTSTNTGDEWHMAGFAKLKEGATLEQLTDALKNAGPDSEEDPTAAFIEEEIDAPGHILQPGTTQSLTVDVLTAGNYVMVCFLPTEGGGPPHFAQGMVGGFEVEEAESEAEEPAEEAAIVLPDDAEPTGVPTDLESGEHTFKLTSTGEKGKDFIVGTVKDGSSEDAFAAFDTYFAAFETEEGPPKGFAKEAPGTIIGSTFEIQPGQSIWMTIDVPKGGVYFINTTNTESEDEESTVDKFVKVDVK